MTENQCFSVWMWDSKKCEIHPDCVLQNALHFHHQISKIRQDPAKGEAHSCLETQFKSNNFVTRQAQRNWKKRLVIFGASVLLNKHK